jgi:hypothetical protein
MKNEFLIKQRDINYGGKVINTHPRQREEKQKPEASNKKNERTRGVRRREINAV